MRRAAPLLLLAAALAACGDGPARPTAGAPTAGGGSAPAVSIGGTTRAYYGHVR